MVANCDPGIALASAIISEGGVSLSSFPAMINDLKPILSTHRRPISERRSDESVRSAMASCVRITPSALQVEIIPLTRSTIPADPDSRRVESPSSLWIIIAPSAPVPFLRTEAIISCRPSRAAELSEVARVSHRMSDLNLCGARRQSSSATYPPIESPQTCAQSIFRWSRSLKAASP